MFKSISINNFRAITNLEIDNFGQVNLLVGNNNCGKTTVLEALFLLIGATNPQLPLTINGLRGLSFIHRELWPTFFRNMDVSLPIEIAGKIHGTDEEHMLVVHPRLEKQIETKPVEGTSDIQSLRIENSETLQANPPNGLKLAYSNSELPERNNESEIFEKDDKVVLNGKKDTPFQGILISPTQAFDWKARFAPAQRKKLVMEIVSLLQEIDPNIADLRLNEIGLLEADIGLPRLIPINLMGGGIAKCLTISLAILDYQNGVVFIDEFENGLHHSVQQALWKAVFSWAQKLNIQVFATTHSYECVKAFSNSISASLFDAEAKLFRIERKEEEFRAVELTKEVLAEALDSNWEIR
ncbi:ATP/GTP-binding protein [Planctomycetota bacterium]